MSIEAPIDRHRESVRPEWIDYNGHMNVAYYVLVFDHATDVMFDLLGIGEAYRQASGHSFFALDAHIAYLREVDEGTPLRVSSQLVDHDDKRIHFAHSMFHGDAGHPVSVYECVSVHVDMAARRAAPMAPDTLARVAEAVAAHRVLLRPAEVGRAIGIRHRRAGANVA